MDYAAMMNVVIAESYYAAPTQPCALDNMRDEVRFDLPSPPSRQTHMSYEWKGLHSRTCRRGQLSCIKKKVPVTKTILIWRTRTRHRAQSKHFKHADTELG
eukprot:scaffold47980_cov21-Tisochrysis_lutea.AAC.1